MTKNPNSSHWRTIVFNIPSYTLGELADYVDLQSEPIYAKSINDIESRNCMLFHKCLLKNKRSVLSFKKKNLDYNSFYEKVLSEMEYENSKLPNKLRYSEIRSIAKSCSRWLWKNFTLEKFSRIQRSRSEKRWTTQKDIYNQIWEKYGSIKPDLTLKEIAEEFNVSLPTIKRWSKKFGWSSSRAFKTEKSKQSAKEVVLLREQGYTYKDISEKLELHETTVKKLYKSEKLKGNINE